MKFPTPIDVESILKQEMKTSGFSRAQIADRMNQFQKHTVVTETHLNKWAARSQPRDLPGNLAIAFCFAVKSARLITELAASLGIELVPKKSFEIIQQAQSCPFCLQKDLKTNTDCSVIICRTCEAQAPVEVWLSMKQK